MYIRYIHTRNVFDCIILYHISICILLVVKATISNYMCVSVYVHAGVCVCTCRTYMIQLRMCCAYFRWLAGRSRSTPKFDETYSVAASVAGCRMKIWGKPPKVDGLKPHVTC